MATRNVALIAILLVAAGCQPTDSNEEPQTNVESSPEQQEAPEPVITDHMRQAELEAQQAIEGAENELGHFFEERMDGFDLPPGEWVEENGANICVGFMTRFEDVDYCAAEIPADWVPFEFNGDVYYMQPLYDAGENN